MGVRLPLKRVLLRALLEGCHRERDTLSFCLEGILHAGENTS